MSDDRDLDELLESLDKLLREGESHNDDAAAEAEPASGAGEMPSAETGPPADTDKPEPGEGTRDTRPDDAPDDARPEEPASPGQESPGDEDARDEVATEPDEATSEQTQSGPVHRVVLTEEMLVDNHQARLPLAPPAQQASDRAEKEEPSPERSGGDKAARIEHLVAEVSREITARLQAKLPEWVDQAVRRRLADESTDQKKEQ